MDIANADKTDLLKKSKFMLYPEKEGKKEKIEKITFPLLQVKKKQHTRRQS